MLFNINPKYRKDEDEPFVERQILLLLRIGKFLPYFEIASLISWKAAGDKRKSLLKIVVIGLQAFL